MKFLLFTILATVGGFYAIRALPQDFKTNALAAIGFGNFKNRAIEIFNPAAKREELLNKLEKNLETIKNAGLNESTADKSNITNEVEPIIKESEELIAQIQELNSKTGVAPAIMGKILGIETNPAADQNLGGGATITSDNITPEQKAKICSETIEVKPQ